MKGIYDLDWLLNQVNVEGRKFNYIGFWKPDNDAGRFSQWYMSTFNDGIEGYDNAEQWMMSEKARLFRDMETRVRIKSTSNPSVIKKLGREVRHFVPEVWDASCIKFVIMGNYMKFSQDENLKKYLLSTMDSILVEASPYDAIWGVKLFPDEPALKDPNKWRGTNYLGFALMTVRDILQGKQTLEDIVGEEYSQEMIDRIKSLAL